MNSIFGYEPKISRAIKDNLGNSSAVFSLNEDELRDLFGPWSGYAGKITPEALHQAEKELESLEMEGFRFISEGEPGYPVLLSECPDPPAGLYMKCSDPPERIFNQNDFISVIGTRDLSQYGEYWCRRIVGTLAASPTRPAVVSGLAIGADICAHLAALECGIPTIAVLPTGIRDIYPYKHRKAADRIASTPGCALVTDFPPDTIPKPVNFLRRNRIIAGISRATILIESKSRGGGLMTARLACGYGREVFALPGRIDDIRSAGCNALIREKVAEPVTSLDALADALWDFRLKIKSQPSAGERVRTVFSLRGGNVEKLAAMAEAIQRKRGISLDELCRELGTEYGETAMLAGILENEGIIVTDLAQRCSIAAKIC